MSLATHDEIRAALSAAALRLGQLQFLDTMVIEDYPIGIGGRGKCRLAVQYKDRKGWRTVRETTDKHGRWRKPKYSIYDAFPIAVVTGDFKYEVAWLRCDGFAVDGEAIYLQSANGGCVETVLSRPRGLPHSRPRRKPHHYTLKVGFGSGPLQEEPHVLEADPPEVCDAWDVWEPGLRSLVGIIEEKAQGVPAGALWG